MTIKTKAAWRGHFGASLEALSTTERADQSAALHRQLLALPELRGPKRVLVCLSFGAEPDTWGLLDPLSHQGLEIVIPRTVPKNRTLQLVPWPCLLETRSFGLREPARDIPALPADTPLDAALVLGLGFDRRGVRLGHGAGYFDRFFAEQPSNCLRFGLGFDCQLVDRLPREGHDIAMHAVVTPSEIVWAKEGPTG
jgi:5-formyltetrahydrofolate cyclo-ligase